MIGLDVIFGGLTGLIGNAFTTWFKYKSIKIENEHKEKMLALETRAMIQEAQMQIQVTKARIEGEVELADAAAYKESLKSGQTQMFSEKWIDSLLGAKREGKLGAITGFFAQVFATFIMLGFAFIDWMRGFMRPALTIYLVGASTWLTYMAWGILEKAQGGAITITTAEDVFAQVVSTIIYLAVSAVTWWFGDRTMSKFLQTQGAKRRGGSNGGGGDVNI